MIAPYDIIGYLQGRFQDLATANSDQEIRINSIFTEDDKKKLYINTETGLWICFKSGEKGNFVSLVSILEQCSYRQAEALLADKYAGTTLLARRIINETSSTDLDDFYKNVTVIPYDIPDNAGDIVKKCWAYLFKRRLLTPKATEKFYAGIDGPLLNRLVIPFYANQSTLLYYQARALDPDVKPRYLNCKTNKKSAILYPYNTLDNYVVVCEGPLDAISLQLQHVNATAIMGSSISEEQLRALKMFNHNIIAGFDNDEAGRKSLLTLDRLRKKMNMPPIEFVMPQSPCKDWNEMHCRNVNLKDYISAQRRRFTDLDALSMSISKL